MLVSGKNKVQVQTLLLTSPSLQAVLASPQMGNNNGPYLVESGKTEWGGVCQALSTVFWRPVRAQQTFIIICSKHLRPCKFCSEQAVPPPFTIKPHSGHDSFVPRVSPWAAHMLLVHGPHATLYSAVSAALDSL